MSPEEKKVSCVGYAALCEGPEAPIAKTHILGSEAFALCATCLKLAERHCRDANAMSLDEHVAAVGRQMLQ
jgi:hypothetical protein